MENTPTHYKKPEDKMDEAVCLRKGWQSFKLYRSSDPKKVTCKLCIKYLADNNLI